LRTLLPNIVSPTTHFAFTWSPFASSTSALNVANGGAPLHIFMMLARLVSVNMSSVNFASGR